VKTPINHKISIKLQPAGSILTSIYSTKIRIDHPMASRAMNSALESNLTQRNVIPTDSNTVANIIIANPIGE